MNLDDVDLNLLRVLDALLKTNSVADAAIELHLSAPAVSRSLGRLRRLFDDPLFVRAGRNLVPTPRALELRPQVRYTIDQIAALLQPPTTLEPATLNRRFTIRADEAIIALLAIRLVNELHNTAPNVEVDFLPESKNTVDELRSGQLDLAIGVYTFQDPDLEASTLLTDRFVAAVRLKHPLTDKKLTPARYAAAQHLSVSPRAQRTGPIDVALAKKNLQRTRIMTVPTFVTAGHLVATTDLVGNLPRGLVSSLSSYLPITSLEIPLSLPEFTVKQHWHRRNNNDSGHDFFRRTIDRTTQFLRPDDSNQPAPTSPQTPSA